MQLESNKRSVLSLRKTGLGDKLISLCAAWILARYSYRRLIVDWRYSTYLPGSKNLFGHVFQPTRDLARVPLSVATQTEVATLQAPVYPNVWTEKLAEPWSVAPDAFPEERDKAVALIRLQQDLPHSTIVLNGCVAHAVESFADAHQFCSALNFKSKFVSSAQAFRQKKAPLGPLIGLHVRHGNGGNIFDHATSWRSFDDALSRCERAVELARAKLGFDAPVLLCTDSAHVRQEITQRISGVIWREKQFRENGAGELHLGPEGPRGLDDAVTEMLLLSTCDVLIRYPANSFYTFYPAVMKPTSLPRPVLLEELSKQYDEADDLSPAVLF